VYQPASDEKLAMNLELGWSTRLQEALRQDGFVLYFQPVVPIHGVTAATLPADIDAWGMRCMDGLVHCEVLVRLPDVHGGVIAPGAFLPTAERFGLMPQIDLWVVRAAIAQLARLNGAGTHACLAVNLSGHTLDQRGLAADVKRLLAESGVEPRALMFEITETNAIANLDAARRLIGELRELGCRFALDDFGSGFSSFHHLKHLPVDFVKIDGQFVRGMARDPADRAVVASINDIAHSFGKRTIAEFVESREILELLCECGVDYAQGYYLSPPRPAPARREQADR
jgi:EAL domain-containing protein (putative c-di-GMP-specific phosphodiesterase class I)